VGNPVNQARRAADITNPEGRRSRRPKAAGLCGKEKGSLHRSEVDGDVNLPCSTIIDKV